MLKIRSKEIAVVISILLTKITAAQAEVALSYHKVRGAYFLAIGFTLLVTN